MLDKNEEIYEFGSFRLDISERHLWNGNELLSLTPKVFDLLSILVKNHGHLLEKDELVAELWGESFVEEANLNVNISALRRVLGETPNENKFIETVPRKGYRFVAEVREVTDIFESFEKAFEDTQKEQKPKQTSPKPTQKFSTKTILIFSALILLSTIGGIYLWNLSNQNEKTPPEQLKTIAVLPFKPLTKEGSDEVLEMGMADALITKLSNLQQITVRPTSSVLKYNNENSDIVKIGRELQVEAVLDGKIQRAENKVRVTVQMIRVSDGKSLWADSFDDYFTNIFAVQDSISEKIAEKLSIRLTKAEEQIMSKHHTDNSEAYQLYLQGVFHHNKASPDELKKALTYYQKALEKDPKYVLPYAALAEIYQGLANYNIYREENNRKAKELAEKAINLDANSADAQMALGKVKLYIEWDFAGSGEAFRRALELKPRDSGIRHAYAFYLSTIRRHDEAVREMRNALQFDPVSAYINNDLVRILLNAQHFDEALEQAKRTIELDSNYVYAYRSLALAYSAKGLHREAIEAIEQQNANLGGLKQKSSAAGYIYARAGKRQEAEKILSEYRQSLDEVGVTYSNIAIIYVGLGEKDLAIEWLEKSVQKRESIVVSINSFYEFDNLRNDPRLQDLVEKVGFPH